MSWGWELFWFMVILKIPIVYLAVVVWWAVRARPLPLEPALAPAVLDPDGAPRLGPASEPRWAEAAAAPRLAAHHPRPAPCRPPSRERAEAVSAIPSRSRESLDTLVGLIAAAAIFVAVLAAMNIDMSLGGTQIAFRPIRVGVPAIVLALIAAGIGGRHRRLAEVALGLTGLLWFAGMVVAVITEKPLY